jgi:hypothetical protein
MTTHDTLSFVVISAYNSLGSERRTVSYPNREDLAP